MSSFLDNNSDILLDAVLTDYGRQLLARGDGSFNIVKFAFGDDEIDYSLYDTGSTTPSTAKDVEIMRTPVLEAMTNNVASLKSKLLTIANKNLLFLPVMKQNATGSADPRSVNTKFTFLSTFSCYAVPVDDGDKSYNFLTGSNVNASQKTIGILGKSGNYIRVDQGFDSDSTDKTKTLATNFPDLLEEQYNVTIDNRFGSILDLNLTNRREPTIDDDGMATYTFTRAGDRTYVETMAVPEQNGKDSEQTVIRGTRGTKLRFTIAPAAALSNTNAFDKYGIAASGCKYIKTHVKVTGVLTGYSVDIPVIFVRAS